MTREEAIKNVTTYVYMECENIPNQVIKALDIMRECTQKQIANDTNVGSKWIPCSERLPDGCRDAEIEVIVSLYEPYSETVIQESGFALFYPEDNKFRSVYGEHVDITDIVIAWQPLPEPYKEGET